MIEHLRGSLLAASPGHLVVEVGGVGYGVDVSSATQQSLPTAPGGAVSLHIVTIVREESLRLVGFSATEEREVFLAMIEVPRVGPSIALSALSALGWERLVRAASEKDATTLARIPGVGKKTAERMAIDLESRLKVFAQRAAARGLARGGGTGTGQSDEPTSAAAAREPVVAEAIAALEALGCKPAVASRAVERALEIVGRDVPVADLIRESLRHRY